MFQITTTKKNPSAIQKPLFLLRVTFFLKPLGASSIFARRRRTESRAGKSKGWRVAWARPSRDESAGELLGVSVMLLKNRLSAA